MTDDELKILSKHTAVSDEFLCEIGRITAHFALLERDLINLTHQLLGLPDGMARSITSELSFRGLQQLSASLLRERLPNEVAVFEKILGRVSKAEEKRNAVAHSLWGAGWQNTNGERTVIRTKFTAKQKKGLNLVREELTATDLKKIAYQISVAAYDVEEFSRSLLPRRAT